MRRTLVFRRLPHFHRAGYPVPPTVGAPTPLILIKTSPADTATDQLDPEDPPRLCPGDCRLCQVNKGKCHTQILLLACGLAVHTKHHAWPLTSAAGSRNLSLPFKSKVFQTKIHPESEDRSSRPGRGRADGNVRLQPPVCNLPTLETSSSPGNQL